MSTGPAPERLVAAAIRPVDSMLILSMPRPSRHDSVIKAAVSLGIEVRGAEQGFLTDDGRFLSRRAAELAARRSGQLQGKIKGGVLTSEDLW